MFYVTLSHDTCQKQLHYTHTHTHNSFDKNKYVVFQISILNLHIVIELYTLSYL
jgi:hypothetical protein